MVSSNYPILLFQLLSKFSIFIVAMAYSDSCRQQLLTISLIACYLSMFCMVTGRPLSDKPSTLLARLKLEGGGGAEGGSTKCWDSLFQLQSCTGEVILFFLNGETYLGPSCCNAIKNIEHQCWPSMLGSLGYTSQEGDMLLGYCDSSSHGGPSSTTTPPKAHNGTTVFRVPHTVHA